jgi:hypothetical protein
MMRSLVVSFVTVLVLMLAVTNGEARRGEACAPQKPVAGTRLAEGSSRACMASCIAQCRAQEEACGSSGRCATQYQICARRCVVTCGSR